MFASTSEAKDKVVSFAHTLLHPLPGPSPALWMPRCVPRVASWPNPEAPLWQFVQAVLEPLLHVDCEKVCRDALGAFPIALEREPHPTLRDLWTLQLHRGPTQSFKDVGCRTAAALHNQFLPDSFAKVFVATSGDTGSAAAAAFGPQACVLYPLDRVSPFQEKQMLACKDALCMAVPGDFDRCQALVKNLLQKERGLSCNSISLARLLPQAGYYAFAAARRPNMIFIVPSGNYGNATACLLAMCMGAPIAGVHLACNENGRALLELWSDSHGTMKHFRPRKTVPTPASAMDVGYPSNLVRLQHLLKQYPDMRTHISASVTPSARILELQNDQVCPHTACALDAAEKLDGSNKKLCIVRTADACKFSLTPQLKTRTPLILHKPAILSKNIKTLLLIGMPATGKSTLAARLNGQDGDAVMVQQAHVDTLPQVVATFPTPDAFFAHEGRTLIELLHTSRVVASGGSALHSEALCQHLEQASDILVVHLCRDDSAKRCVDWAARGVVVPACLTQATPQQIYAHRLPLYMKYAHVELRTDLWSPERCTKALNRLKREVILI